MNFTSKCIMGIAIAMTVTTSHAQFTIAENGLSSPQSSKVTLGGTLLLPTSLDFGSGVSTTNFTIKKGSSNYWFIGNDGNIGVGNNSPAHKLDVSGMIHSNTGFKYANPYGATLDNFDVYARMITNTSTGGLLFWTTQTPSSIRFSINNAARGLVLDGNTSNLLFTNSDGNYLGGIGSANGTGNLTFLYSNAPGTHTEGARLTSTGNVGIGTSNPSTKLEVSNGTNNIKIDPDGAALTISGAYQSYVNHPKLNFKFNGDANPSMSIMNYGHDNITLSFDAHHNGSTWLSSSSESNFGIIKGTNELVIGYNSGTAAGSSFSQYNWDGARFTRDGKVGIGGLPYNAKLFVNGNVGFGAINPDQLLTLNAASGVNSVVSFQQAGITKSYVGLGTDGVFRNQTLAGTELQLRADGGSNFISLFTNSSEKMRVTAAGNVGIGVTAPTAKLHTSGTVRLEGLTNDNAQTRVLVSDANGNITYRDASSLGSGGSVSGSTNYIAKYSSTTSISNSLLFDNGTNVGVGTATPNTNAKLDVNGNIFSSGKIAIGTTDMANISTYSLAVNGDAIFNKVKVKAYPWADYVFEMDYPLPTLLEVEQFIQKNKHLPGVPTAKEVEKNGLDVAETQTILLQKIEELTLYVIQLKKEIDELKRKK